MSHGQAWPQLLQRGLMVHLSRVSPRRAAEATLVFILALPALRFAFLIAALSYHVSHLQQLADNPSPTALASAGGTIQAARWDIVAVRNEWGFLLRLGPALKTVPVIGPDLVHADSLLDMAAHMLIAADEAYRGLAPIMLAAVGDQANPAPNAVLDHLVQAEPEFAAALDAARRAEDARAAIPHNQLSPIGQRLVQKTDRVLTLLKQGVAAINLAPYLMGSDGPRSYLMIIQNQDELRATGGFISAAGLLTIEDGDVKSLTIQDSYAVGTYTVPQPYGPLAKYMDADFLVLRDANWSPDFPVAATQIAALYQGDHPGQAIDGIIALDQSAIAILLKATGPITVQDVPELIHSDNLISYMRSSWSAEPGEGVSYDWWLHRKDFMQNMAGSLIKSLRHGSWAALGQAGTQALRQKHILVWMADPRAAALLAEQGWDGALRPYTGDYLFVVESNLGFNKVNAVVQKRYEYAVDLTDLSAPAATVSITDFNPASGEADCIHKPDYGGGTYDELIARCYWNYVRVYAPQGARILDASIRDIPAEWIITGTPTLGTLDLEATRSGHAGFGTLTIVPFGATETTSFSYSLPTGAVLVQEKIALYTLTLQKQPGTQRILTDIAVSLPAGANLLHQTVDGQVQDGIWRWRVELDEDIVLRIEFQLP